MIDDLYEILGVARDATFDDILAGWRAQVRRWHPDKPKGDAEMFRKVQEAYNVLKNAKRRENYDRTGDTKERPEGADDAEAMNYLSQLIQEAIGNVKNPGTDSLIKEMNRIMERQISHVANEKAPYVAQLEKRQKVMERVKAKKDKRPLISMLLKAQIDAIQVKIDAYTKQESTIKRVREIVDDHTYTTENAAAEESTRYLGNSTWR